MASGYFKAKTMACPEIVRTFVEAQTYQLNAVRVVNPNCSLCYGEAPTINVNIGEFGNK
jgi:hypothetical protein